MCKGVQEPKWSYHEDSVIQYGWKRMPHRNTLTEEHKSLIE